MHPSLFASVAYSDEKEQLSWPTLPSLQLALPHSSTRPASALPAQSRIPVVNVGAPHSSSSASPHATLLAGHMTCAAAVADSHAATAWRCLSDRQPRIAAVSVASPPAAAVPPSSSDSSTRAPFNSSALRFTPQSANSSRQPQHSPAACTSASASPFSSPSSAFSTFSLCAASSSPSHSSKGFGVGFVSAAPRFPPSLCSRPSPASYHTEAAHVVSQHHAARASAAFHSANHDGRHLPPQPSEPRVAASQLTAVAAAGAIAAPTPPSVPFVAAYHLRRPNPAPNAYCPLPQPSTAALTTKAASMGVAARQAPFEAELGRAEWTPSSVSYSPRWQSTRPSSSNAASVHFTSLSQRMPTPHTQHERAATTLSNTRQPQSADAGRTRHGAQQRRPHTAGLPLPPRTAHKSAALHTAPAAARSWLPGPCGGNSGLLSPSPADYTVRLDSSRPHAPQHSFAQPKPLPPPQGVAALLVTRGGPGLGHNLTSTGRAADKQKRWQRYSQPTDAPAPRERGCSAGSGSDSSQQGGVALSHSDSSSLTAHHSFHYNCRNVWL